MNLVLLTKQRRSKGGSDSRRLTLGLPRIYHRYVKALVSQM